MKVIVCADQKNGLLFNRRRQSQDRELRKRILSMIGEGKLYLSAYSACQFTESEWADRLVVCEDPLEAAGIAAADGYYFAEGQPLATAVEAGALQEIILYRWDKVYPADIWLDLPLTDEKPETAVRRTQPEEKPETASGCAQPGDRRETASGQSRPDAFGNQQEKPAAHFWRLTASEDFAGYSHEKITEEIYRLAAEPPIGQ